MNALPRPLRARTAVPRALVQALQWRLLLLWVLASLGVALIAALPAWNWLGSVLDHSVHAEAIARGEAPMLLIDALMARTAPLPTLAVDIRIATVLMLLLSPLLVGAILTSARATMAPGFGDLLRGAIGEYWPLLRLMLWSVLPLGAAIAVLAGLLALNGKLHEHAILASELDIGRNLALIVGGLLVVVAHAGVEAGRGWMAADARLRSAIRAWWRGTVLVLRRPIAALSAYLIPWLLALVVAILLLALRQRLGGGLAVGLLFSCLLSAALAWGKAARLFALRTLVQGNRAIT